MLTSKAVPEANGILETYSCKTTLKDEETPRFGWVVCQVSFDMFGDTDVLLHFYVNTMVSAFQVDFPSSEETSDGRTMLTLLKDAFMLRQNMSDLIHVGTESSWCNDLRLHP